MVWVGAYGLGGQTSDNPGPLVVTVIYSSRGRYRISEGGGGAPVGFLQVTVK